MEIFTDTTSEKQRFTISLLRERKSGRYEMSLQINLTEVITYQDYYDRKSSVIQVDIFSGKAFSIRYHPFNLVNTRPSIES